MAEPFFPAECLVVPRCIADLAAAGHDEVSVPAARKTAVLDQPGENPGQLPAVSRSRKYPGLLRKQLRRDAVPDEGNGVQQRILQLVRQLLGTVPAVAGAGKINDQMDPSSDDDSLAVAAPMLDDPGRPPGEGLEAHLEFFIAVADFSGPVCFSPQAFNTASCSGV